MNITDNKIKFRHEYKYQITTGQMLILQSRIKKLMPADNNAKNGSYTVRSLYFDNYDNKCYFENENSEEPRQKFRIRTYNNSTDIIKLEVKKKIHGKSLKLYQILDIDQAKKYIDGICINSSENNKLLKEFNSKILSELYHPVVITEYTRTPYLYKNGNVRVTFDTDISASNKISQFFNRNISKRPIIPIGMNIMEVKFDEYLPDIIFKTLQMDNLNLITFSKYYLCRKYSL